MLETIYACGYSPSDLISHVFSEAPLFCNVHPDKILEETDERILKTFYAICQMNVFLSFEEKKILIANINFEKNFKNAISFASAKTKASADFYPSWFKMCNHLKFLFYFNEEKGKELFFLFSALSEKFNERECENFWNKCNPKFGSIPGVFSIIDKYIPPPAKLPNRRELIRKTFFS